MALPLGEQLEKIGETRNDAAAQLLGRYAQGVTRFISGNSLPPAPSWSGIWALLSQCIAPWDCPSTPNRDAAYLALTLACLGYIDQARSRMEKRCRRPAG